MTIAMVKPKQAKPKRAKLTQTSTENASKNTIPNFQLKQRSKNNQFQSLTLVPNRRKQSRYETSILQLTRLTQQPSKHTRTTSRTTRWLDPRKGYIGSSSKEEFSYPPFPKGGGEWVHIRILVYSRILKIFALY